MKIAIHSPPYHSASGGIRVLHYLGYLSHRLGHQVDMCSGELNPDWGGYSKPLANWDVRLIPEIDPPSQVGPTVRWVLYFPGALAGPATYPNDEMVVSFHPAYTEAACAAAPGREVTEFFLPVCDMTGMDEQLDRDVPALLWVGKGPRVDLPALHGIPEITRGWPAPRRELIRTMKRCRRLYSMDRHTAINDEAQLCGCEVFVWDDSAHTFRPWYNPNAGQMVMNEFDQLLRVESFWLRVKQYFKIGETR